MLPAEVELRQKRAAVIKRARENWDATRAVCERERRCPTDAERKSIDDALGEADELREEVEKIDWATERERRLRDGEAEMDRLVTPRTGRAPEVPEARTWRGADGESIRVLAPQEKMSSVYGSDAGADIIGRCALAIARQNPSGLFRPNEVRALGGLSDIAGGFALTGTFASDILDTVRAESVIFRAGARTLPMGSRDVMVLKIDTDPTASWSAESISLSDAPPTFGRATLRARTVRTFFKMSEELAADAPNAIEAATQAAVGALQNALDAAVLGGPISGSGECPTGVRNVTGTTAQASIASPLYTDLLTAVYNAELNNAPRPYQLVAHPRTWNTLAQQVTGITSDLTQLAPPVQVAELTKFSTTNISIVEGAGSNESYFLLGPFQSVVVGIRNDVTIASIQYPPSFEKWIAVAMRVDVVIPRPSFFVVGTGITA